MSVIFHKKTWTVLLLLSFYLILFYTWRTSDFGFDKFKDNVKDNFYGLVGACQSGNLTNELANRLEKKRYLDYYDFRPVMTVLMNDDVGLFVKEYTLEDHDPGILEMQKCLNKLGFTIALTGPGSTGMETDKYGLGTADALTRFQKHNNLICKLGVPDLVTRVALNKACKN